MSIDQTATHEIYTRRKGRNVAVLVILLAFVVLVFSVTIVKMGNGASMEAFDHAIRPSILPEVSQ